MNVYKLAITALAAVGANSLYKEYKNSKQIDDTNARLADKIDNLKNRPQTD